MTPQDKAARMRKYFDQLTVSDIEGIIAMFAEDTVSNSSYLREMPSAVFLVKLSEKSQKNKLTLLEVLIGKSGTSAAVHLEFD